MPYNMRTWIAAVLVVVLCAAPATAGPGWANMTVSDWRKADSTWRTAVVLGAMNASVMVSIWCERAISADMVASVLNAGGEQAIDGDKQVAEAVWSVMGTYFNCRVNKKS